MHTRGSVHYLHSRWVLLVSDLSSIDLFFGKKCQKTIPVSRFLLIIPTTRRKCTCHWASLISVEAWLMVRLKEVIIADWVYMWSPLLRHADSVFLPRLGVSPAPPPLLHPSRLLIVKDAKGGGEVIRWNEKLVSAALKAAVCNLRTLQSSNLASNSKAFRRKMSSWGRGCSGELKKADNDKLGLIRDKHTYVS